ncbi:MAG: NAD-dependent epimerase/dehydratase family protein [Gallionella sp.]|jgi:UDP-glucose 4-epimerase|nr:NAD-dependent epimerase/dehydratase family protein [Gallionella sp.]
MSKVLVTGACGFIASHLVDRLVKEGHEVYGIDDLSEGLNNENPKATYYYLDLRDTEATDTFVTKIKPEIVYHLASHASENKAQFNPIEIFTNNYNTFLNTLVPALRNGMKRIIVASSIAVYGGIKPPFTEEDRPKPEDIYGWAKLMMEETLEILAKVHGFEYVIVRPHNVYGPRQSAISPYRNVIALWMNTLLKGESYTIYGAGGQRRAYTYIDDLVDGLYKCGFENVAGEIFNLGADEAFTLTELSDVLQEVTESNILPTHLPDRPQEVVHAVEDHTKAKKVLGYKTSVDLKEGLRRTWAYAKSRGPQDLVYTDIELPSEKMPKNWIKK